MNMNSVSNVPVAFFAAVSLPPFFCPEYKSLLQSSGSSSPPPGSLDLIQTGSLDLIQTHTAPGLDKTQSHQSSSLEVILSYQARAGSVILFDIDSLHEVQVASSPLQISGPRQPYFFLHERPSLH
ncbi:unnamed protein product [Prorocentrum cordatum]|uniref:Uncharacterized protein n=1 Tax=Prorocentrum cordatum TaxID=2364126 RepID=A0ABN9QW49_9DINO|nr:unnamed protein product [Polarella glacialis]